MNSKQLVGIALAVSPGLPPNLNQHLLFVDRLGIVGLDEVRDDLDHLARTWPHNPADIIRLRDAGVAFALPNRLDARLLNHPEAGPVLEAAAAATERAKGYLAEFSRHVPEERVAEFFTKMNLVNREGMLSRSYVARAVAISTRLNMGFDTVSLLPIIDERSAEITRESALRLTIESLPVPNDNVPPLEIIRFREDADNRQRLVELRAWAGRVARGGITANEIRDELEVAVGKFEASLRQLQRTHTRRRIAFFMTAIPRVIRELLGLEVAKVGESVFEIASIETRLFEEERTLPGREVSYIVAAEQKFGGAEHRC